jgi:WD40 repeat protein
MVKLRAQLLRSVILAALLPSCASHPPASPRNESAQPVGFAKSSAPVTPKKRWTVKTPGLLTDLNLSGDGNTVLVATIPDRDSVEAGANHSRNFAAIYSADGKTLAEIEMPAQIKSQALSEDGQLALVATYDDTIRAYDRVGKELWNREAICKPIVLSAVHQILCFHDDDDDAEPELGFEIYDWDGHDVTSFPVKQDSLMLKISENQKYFVIGLNHGKAVLFSSSTYKPLWTKSVDGEITDLAISSPDSGVPVVSALYNVKKKASKKHKSDPLVQEQKIQTWGGQGKDSPKEVSTRLDQIELSPDGSSLFGYGNDADGQIVTRLDQNTGALAWKRGDPSAAEYSSQMQVSQDWVWVGFEDMSKATRHSHVLGFDFQGGLKSDIVVPAEEGSYLYAYAFAPRGKALAVGSDDGELSLFDVK